MKNNNTLMSVSEKETKEKNIDKKEFYLDFFVKNGFLISPDFFDYLISEQTNPDDIINMFKNILENKKFQSNNSIIYLNKDAFLLLKKNVFDVNWKDFEKYKAKKEYNETSIYDKIVSNLSQVTETAAIEKTETKAAEAPKDALKDVKIVFSYKDVVKKRNIQDFVAYFNRRYELLSNMIRSREELNNLVSISRILKKTDKSSISIIGLVKDKTITSNKNIILTLEDPTGEIKVLINKNKPELIEEARDIVFDEVIGISGVSSRDIVFCNNIIWPDVPIKELKKSDKEEYALFLSDIHVGSNNFLEDKFNNFLKWINKELGDERQKEIASKVRYIFIMGDIVDGVGIYPRQEEELDIKDIYKQFEKAAELLSKIPKHIPLIISGGNHDPLRLYEPQPELPKDFAAPLYALENTIFVTNPAIVNIASTPDFSGFDVLMYHGYSFDYYIANVDTIRNQGGYDRADLMMKFLLKRRHLAPTHSSTLYIPDTKTDPLVITKVPDFFVTGHIHKTSISNYKNISLISGSCWQSKTSFQEKVGHHPEPARVPYVNLKTREIKVLRF